MDASAKNGIRTGKRKPEPAGWHECAVDGCSARIASAEQICGFHKLELEQTLSLNIPEANSYTISDATLFLKSMPSGLLRGVATSPPYNKSFKGRGKNGAKSNWPKSKLMEDDYTLHNDNLPEDVYVQWQRDFLDAALQAVGDCGVVLYNIGRRIKDLSEDRRQDIVSGFPVRQTIIWNRGSSNNQGGRVPSIFPPIYELIYVISGKDWRLPARWLPEMRKWGDVWSIRFQNQNHNPHPAPFPLELAERMVKTVDGPIADPFAGSGTIGIAAETLGIPYYLNDHSAEYKRMFESRLLAMKEERAWTHN